MTEAEMVNVYQRLAEAEVALAKAQTHAAAVEVLFERMKESLEDGLEAVRRAEDPI